MKVHLTKCFILFTLAFELVSCSQQPRLDQTVGIMSQTPTELYPYPDPLQSTRTSGAYPPPLRPLKPTTKIDTYPEPVSSQIIAGGPPFELNRPIIEGTSLIEGSGPAGVPILIVDVTMMGEVLGQGVIDSTGEFAIETIPVELGHRIGIMLGILEGTQWQPESFQSNGYFGKQALTVPMVGFLYDTTMVQGK